MIVTCPSCATRYLIDPRSLGTAGRSVRCTECDHVWMQLPAEDAPHRVDLPVPGAPRMPARAAAIPPVAAAVPRRAAPATVAAIPDTQARFVTPAGRSVVTIPMIAIVVLAALWFGRDTILDYMPALEKAYAAVGLGASRDPRDDLEFREVTSDRAQENGRPTLVITGEVANISSAARRVPPLRVTIEDSARHAVKSWTLVATEQRLRPGASVAFRTIVADPGDNAVGASVSFDDGD